MNFFQINMDIPSPAIKRKYIVETETETNSNRQWPRFLVMERKDGSFEKVSFILVHKTIVSMAGEPKTLKLIAPNKYLIETTKAIHSDLLMKISKMANFDVQISPHRNLNSSKGVMKSPQLKYSTEEEILDELKIAGVTEVKKIKITREGKMLPTGTHILSFNSSVLPKSVKIASLNIPIEPYIPNPLRCFKCQHFGHHSTKCTKNSICPRCGESGHPEAECTSTVKCSNCNGAHPAYSRKCPRWQMEKQIQIIKYTQNISFPEARKIVQAQTATTQQASYASVVGTIKTAKKTSSIATQTDPNIFSETKLKSSYVQTPDKISASSLSANTPKPSISTSTPSSRHHSGTPSSSTPAKQPSKSKLPRSKPSLRREIIAQGRTNPLSSMETEEIHDQEPVDTTNRFTPLSAMETDESVHGRCKKTKPPD